MEGIKHDQDKPDYSLFQKSVLDEVSKVMMYGAKKYSRDNWMKISKNRYISASMRHIFSTNDGELIDPESGLSHLAHSIASQMFALWHEQNPSKKFNPEQE